MPSDRRIYFYVHYRNFHGGHLKTRDYFDHARLLPGYEAGIVFSPKTVWDDASPWHDVRRCAVDPARAGPPDCHFVAGVGWDWMDRAWGRAPAEPVLNLIQHVRHGVPENPRFQYLARPAIRIGVSEEVTVALRETGIVNGPVVTIPNGLPAGAWPAPPPTRDVDVTILAVKKPELGQQLAAHLRAAGRSVSLVDGYLARAEFLAQMQRATVVLCLPNATEGFYLPALEAMMAGALVVCPDCIGNRSFCRPGETAIMPEYTETALLAGVDAALTQTTPAATRMREAAAQMAAGHTLERERARFTAIVGQLDALWEETHGQPA